MLLRVTSLQQYVKCKEYIKHCVESGFKNFLGLQPIVCQVRACARIWPPFGAIRSPIEDGAENHCVHCGLAIFDLRSWTFTGIIFPLLLRLPWQLRKNFNASLKINVCNWRNQRHSFPYRGMTGTFGCLPGPSFFETSTLWSKWSSLFTIHFFSCNPALTLQK